MKRISVITIALNEEANIGPCLESVRWADECIVVDSGSMDRTREIARENGARVLELEWEGYGATKNRALDQATGDWVLWLDADERVTPGLAEEIRGILADPPSEEIAFSVPRKAFFLGRWIRHCGWYPSRVTRFFLRGKGRFSENKVHERLMTGGRVGALKNDLLHLTYPSLEVYFSKFNRYTSLAAEEMLEDGRRFRPIYLIIRPLFTFFHMYVLRRGFLDGFHGFILCVLSSFYVFVKYAKLRELQISHDKQAH